jgi:hypothetical protein
MELFPATNDEKWTLIKRVIDDPDYYLVIVGGRYGSIDHMSGISYTEQEYDYAIQRRTPVMAFLHKSPGELSLNKSELNPDLGAKLREFRERLEQRPVKY